MDANRRRRDGQIIIQVIILVVMIVLLYVLWSWTCPVKIDWYGTVTELRLSPNHDVRIQIESNQGKQSIRVEEGVVFYQPKTHEADKIQITPERGPALLGNGFSATPLPAKPLEISSETSGLLEFEMQSITSTYLTFNHNNESLQIIGPIGCRFPAFEFSLLNADLKLYRNDVADSTRHKISAASLARYPTDDIIPLVLEIETQESSTKLLLSRNRAGGRFHADVPQDQLELASFRPTALTVNGMNFTDDWNEVDVMLTAASRNGLTVSLLETTEAGIVIRIHGKARLSGNGQIAWDMNPNWIASQWRKGNGIVYAFIAALIIAANALIAKGVEYLCSSVSNWWRRDI